MLKQDINPKRNLFRTVRYISFAFASLAFVLIIVCVTSLSITREMRREYDTHLLQEYNKLELINRLFHNKESIQLIIRSDAYTPDAEESAILRKEFETVYARNTLVLQQLDTLVESRAEKAIIASLRQEWRNLRKEAGALQRLEDSEGTEAVRSFLHTEIAPFYIRHQALLIKLDSMVTAGAKLHTNEAISMVSGVVQQYALLLILALITVMAAAYLLRKVFKQLRRENKTLLREIQERQELQKSLLKSKEDYHNLFDRHPIPSLVYDQDSLRILDANTAALKEYGYTREEFLSLTVADIRPAVQRQQFMEKLSTLMKHAEATSKGYQHQRKDGSVFSVEVRSHSLPRSGGVFPRLVVVVNVQEREEALALLHTKEQLLREISSSMPGAIYQYQLEPDGSFSFPFISEGIANLCDITPEEVYQNPLELYKNLSDEGRLKVIQSTMESCAKLIPWEQEMRVWRPKLQKYTWVRGHSLPTRKPDGSVLWNGTFIDISNQIEAQEQLRHNEAKLRALLDSSLQSVFLLDKHLQVIDFNKEAAADVRRYLLLEVQVGKSMLDYVAKDQIPQLQDFHAQAMQGLSIVYEQGQENFWHEISFLPVISPEQGILGVALSIRDISEQKRSFETIKRNELLLARAQQLAKLGSWEYNVRHDEMTWSEGMYSLFGLEREDFAASMHSMLQRIHPDDRENVKAGHLATLQTKEHLNLEYRILLPDKSVAYVLEVAEAISDEYGQVVRLYGTVQDITDRKRAEQEVTEARNLLQKTIENIPEIIFAAQPDLSIIYISPQCEQITGFPEHAFVGEGTYWMQSVHSAENLPLLQEVLPEVLAGRVQDFEMRLTDSVGRRRWLLLRLSPEVAPTGSVNRIYGTASDMTAYKEAEARQQELSQQLLKQNLNLQQFAYIVSHNLRAPIANMLGLTSIYDSRDLTAPINQKVIANLIKSAQLLDSTIRDLNEILTLRSEEDLAYETVRFSCLLQDVLDMLKLNTHTCQADIEIDFDAAPEVSTVRSYAKSILLNLLSNAIKYKSPDRKLRIRVYTLKLNDYICLRVEDNGIGIDLQKQRDHVFGLYKRFHKGIEGKGIGLHLVKTQIEILGGKVEVESQPQVGSSFCVYFKKS